MEGHLIIVYTALLVLSLFYVNPLIVATKNVAFALGVLLYAKTLRQKNVPFWLSLHMCVTVAANGVPVL